MSDFALPEEAQNNTENVDPNVGVNKEQSTPDKRFVRSDDRKRAKKDSQPAQVPTHELTINE